MWPLHIIMMKVIEMQLKLPTRMECGFLSFPWETTRLWAARATERAAIGLELIISRLRIYESHIFEQRIKTWMKVILAVMCTTWAVVKIRPEKNSGLYGIWPPWPLRYRYRTAPVSQRSWVQIPYRPEFFPGLIFTTAQVVHITTRITFIHDWLVPGPSGTSPRLVSNLPMGGKTRSL